MRQNFVGSSIRQLGQNIQAALGLKTEQVRLDLQKLGDFQLILLISYR